MFVTGRKKVYRDISPIGTYTFLCFMSFQFSWKFYFMFLFDFCPNMQIASSTSQSLIFYQALKFHVITDFLIFSESPVFKE